MCLVYAACQSHTATAQQGIHLFAGIQNASARGVISKLLHFVEDGQKHNAQQGIDLLWERELLSEREKQIRKRKPSNSRNGKSINGNPTNGEGQVNPTNREG
ncbi:hypothetical protein SUGI_0411350 [Cryptomeria japonica]|nr:hypothetical protein SUGI_0411350 [Cryptomeria japonica]